MPLPTTVTGVIQINYITVNERNDNQRESQHIVPNLIFCLYYPAKNGQLMVMTITAMMVIMMMTKFS